MGVSLMVVEDDALIATDLSALLTDLGYDMTGICSNSEKAKQKILERRPDMLLLDINLGGGSDGIELAAWVNDEIRIPFIFVTGHTDRLTLDRVKAVRPSGFIIKPFNEDDLRTQIEIALARFAARVEATKDPGPQQRQDFLIDDNIFVRDKGRLVKVPIDDIIYVEADNNYIVLHTKVKRFVQIATLKAYEQKLTQHGFMRVHRSYLVDLRRIAALEEHTVLVEGTSIPVGRARRTALKERLGL